MRIKGIYLYIALFLVHVVIALVAFQHFWKNPNGVLFSDFGDGLKNIFTIATYAREPLTADGIFKYNSMQYPFGDYVYYTDNTPLFSIPFRWVCRHVYDLSAHTLPILYTVLVLNILLCGLLVYYVLKRLTGERTISFIMAVVLPWANMQVLRIWVGHNAFSFTSLILLAIVLLIQWHKHRDSRSKLLLIAGAMCMLSLVGFLAQGYYLAILTSFMCGSLFFRGCFLRREPEGRFTMLMAGAVGVVSVGLVLFVLGLTDGYLAMRPENATGYDWMELKVRFTGLFSHYNFQRLYFPVMTGVSITEAEKAAYLGNVALYACLLLGIAMVASGSFRVYIMKVQRDFFRDPLKSSMFLGGLALLFVSFGEHYYTQEPHKQGLHIVNILNPFFYIHFVTHRVEQFRALERFIWPFFFVFNIWIIWTIVAVFRDHGKKVKVGIVAGLLFFGGWELTDFMRQMRWSTQCKNMFSADSLRSFGPEKIDYLRYQAILPIPYYSVGGEKYDYTIDDFEEWSNFTYRLSWKSSLPLMASKMSRTPFEHNLMLMNMVAYGSLDKRLKDKLTNKPVLVAVCRKLLTDNTCGNIPPAGEAAKVYWAALHFTERNHLAAIDSADGVLYYEWQPK